MVGESWSVTHALAITTIQGAASYLCNTLHLLVFRNENHFRPVNRFTPKIEENTIISQFWSQVSNIHCSHFILHRFIPLRNGFGIAQ